jgi:hypothetical protein
VVHKASDSLRVCAVRGQLTQGQEKVDLVRCEAGVGCSDTFPRLNMALGKSQ